MKNFLIKRIAALSRCVELPDQWLRRIYSPDHRQTDFMEMVIPYDGDLKIQIHTGSFFEWEIFFKGYYEGFVCRLLKEYIKPGNTCIDIGANVGTNTLLMAKLAGPKGSVYAFEPNPGYFQRLKENLALNDFENVHTLMKGIDTQAGQAKLFVAGGPVKTASMVDYSDQPGAIQCTIELTSADECLGDLKRCDFIKIDVDGIEGRIMQSCAKVLEKFRPVVLFEYCESAWSKAEWSFSKTADQFQALNYRLHQVDLRGNLSPLESPGEYCNIFCMPEGRSN